MSASIAVTLGRERAGGAAHNHRPIPNQKCAIGLAVTSVLSWSKRTPWPGEQARRSEMLVRRLASIEYMGDEDRRLLLNAVSRTRTLSKGEHLIVEGEPGCTINVVLDGSACQYKNLSNGQRQITSFLLPGDLVDPLGAICKSADYNVAALNRCLVAQLPSHALEQLMRSRSRIAAAVWRFCLVQTAIFQAWLANLRRRDAAERLAHLFCEQFLRLRAVGLGEAGWAMDFRIAQTDLADATGLSVVHVNRTMQWLRRQRLIGSNGQVTTILNWKGLQDLAAFDPGYLHLRSADPAASALMAEAQSDQGRWTRMADLVGEGDACSRGFAPRSTDCAFN